MSNRKIRIGLIAASRQRVEELVDRVTATGLVTVASASDHYWMINPNGDGRRFFATRPEVVLLDISDPSAALRTMESVHSILPDAWILVTSDLESPELIIRAMRAGAREFLQEPVSIQALRDALHRFVGELKQHKESTSIGTIHTVVSAKGGSGGTTLSINLAAAASSYGRRKVGLLDFTLPVGDVSAYLNVQSRYDLMDALSARARLDATLLDSYMVSYSGFSVLAGSRSLDSGGLADSEDVDLLLQAAARRFQHTIVDASAATGGDHLRRLAEASEKVLLVLTADLPSVWRADRILETVGRSERVQLVLNRNRKGSILSEGEIEKALDCKIRWKVPNDYQASVEAINAARPVTLMSRSELSQSLRRIASDLLGIERKEKRTTRFRLFAS